MAKSSNAYVDALQKKYQREISGGRSNYFGAPALSRSTARGGTDPSQIGMDPHFADNTPDWLKTLGDPESAVGGALKKMSDESNPVGWILDKLSRTSYGMGAVARSASDAAKTDGIGDDILGALTAQYTAAKGALFPGDHKELVSDVLFEKYDQDSKNTERTAGDVTGRFAGGLAADILTDPLTWIPGAAIARGIKAVPGAAKAAGAISKMAGTAKLPARILEEAPVAAKVAEGTAEELPKAIEGGLKNTAKDMPQSIPGARTSVSDSLLASMEAPTEIPSLAVEGERILDKAADGKLVPKVNKENAVLQAAAKAETPEDVMPAMQKVLRHSQTGDIRPFEKRLANLKRTERVYSDELLSMVEKGLFKEETVAPKTKSPKDVTLTPEEIADDAAAAAVEAAKPANRIGEVVAAKAESFDDWLKSSRDVELDVSGGRGVPKFRKVGEVLDDMEKHPRVIPADATPEVKAAMEAENAAIVEAAAAAKAHHFNLKKVEYPRYLRETAEAAKPSEALISSTPTPAAPKAPKAVQQAARAEGGSSKWVRKRGDELAAFKAELAAKTDASIAAALTGKQTMTYESMQAYLKTLRGAKRQVPLYWEEMVAMSPAEEVSAGVVDAAAKTENVLDKPGIVTAGEQVEAAAGAPLDMAREQLIAHGAGLSEIARKAIDKVKDTQQWLTRDPDFTHTSGKGAARTHATPGVGKAVWEGTYNSKGQLNAARVLRNHYVAEAGALGLKGYDHSEHVMNGVIKDLRAIDEFFWTRGIHGTATPTNAGIPLTLADVFGVIRDSGSNLYRKTLMGRIFDGFGFSPGKGGSLNQGTIDLDRLLEGARTIVERIPVGATQEQLMDELAKVIVGDKPKVIERLKKELLSTRKVEKKEITGITRQEPFNPETGEALAKNAPGPRDYREVFVPKDQAEIAVGEVVSMLMDEKILRGLVQVAHNNAARLAIKFGQDVGVVSKEVLQDIVTAVHNPAASIGDMALALQTIDKQTRAVTRAAAKAGKPLTEGVEDMAAAAVKDQLTDIASIRDIENAEAINRTAQAVANSDGAITAESNAAAQAAYETAAAQGFSNSPVETLLNSADNSDTAMQFGILQKMQPFMTKMAESLIPHSGNATLHSAIPKSGSIVKILQKGWRADLNKIQALVSHGTATQEDIVHAMRYLQDPSVTALSPAQAKVMELLKPTVEQMFETSTDLTQGIMGGFFRNGFDIEHIMGKFKSSRYDIPEKFTWDIKAAKLAAKENGTKVAEELAGQWRTWEIDDPIDFLAKMEHVLGSVATDMAISQESVRIMKAGNHISKTPVKGFVQLPKDMAKSSTLARYFPKGHWFDPEILKEVRRMDEILSESETFTSSFGRFVNQYLDPILNMWKAGMTVWRPGHHVRNMVGDASLSYFADGVKSPIYYRNAIRMQTLRRSYDGWDAIRALRGESRAAEATGKEIGAHVTVKGQKIALSDAEIHKRLMDSGVLPDFRLQEDLLESGGSDSIRRLQKRMQVFDGRAKQAVGRVSEARDDTIRIAHALHVLEHTKGFDTLDELFEFAANRVRKYHPDGADLTGFERKYMRRLFPFYSWTRKALPLVIEGMVLQPGRTMMFPKAMYNYAQAQGIDLKSLADPFPTDQLFPSWMEDQPTGPAFRQQSGEYMSISPGIPAMDILGDFLPGNVNDKANGMDAAREMLKGPLGMLNPELKGGIELLTGKNLGTGGDIHDPGEYIDSQIPGVNTLSSWSGYSPTGTLTSILPGGTPTGLDEQRSVTKGNKGHFDPEGFWNYMLGMQVQNMSTPSAINAAEIQKRDQMAREIKRQGG